MAGLQEAFERIGEATELHLPLTHAAGISLAVTDGRDTLGAVVRGFADVASGRPVGPDTRFQIGSISKSFATLCVLQEEAAGRLALDVSVNELLPWLELPEPFGPITLHHLLTHTSGLMMGVERGPWGIADALFAREFPPTFAPGERFHYSNLGYKLVGHVLEAVTGLGVHEVLMERVLGPLGMASSSGAITEALRVESAVGYEPLLSDRPAHLNHPLAPAVWQPSNTADGSIVSTAPDLCAYARMVLATGDGPHGQVLDRSTFDRWVGPYVDSDERGSRYGYGWDVVDRDGHRVIRHGGGTVGFTALLEIWPDDGIAVAVCQNGAGDKDALGRIALAHVGAALRGEPFPDVEPFLPADSVPEAASLAGRYRDIDERTIELVPREEGILLRAGPVGVRLERWADDRDVFAVPHPAFDKHLLRVVRDEGGTAVAVTHGPRRFDRGGVPPEDLSVPEAWEAFAGLYRADAPWAPAARVYLRRGRPYLSWPSEGEESELTPLDHEWFAVGDPALPRRCRFRDLVGERTQTLEYNGALLTRSFED